MPPERRWSALTASLAVLALLAHLGLLAGRAPAASVSVDLGATDQRQGLSNTQRGQSTDGENDPATCGPPGETRGSRVNRGAADDDVADAYAYFLVTDPAVKGARSLWISATANDDPAFAAGPVEVRLHYTNAASSGPGDIPDTFAPHAGAFRLAGSGTWLRHTWKVADAGFRTFMQGTSDFRLDLGSARVCLDRVEVRTEPESVEPEEHLIGAHYYPWYTFGRWSYTECVAGALRLELDPPQPPVLGRYDSSSPQVVDQHLRWCAEHGVNVLILEFIAPGSREDQVCRDVIFRHPRSGDVRFSVLYDWAIRFGNGFEATPERIATARADFRHLAREYFAHPSYLKVRGELPLAMIYVTRALSGNVAGLSDALREACASEGLDVFLVGDELFFPSPPDSAKIRRWDGIFGYDAYAGRGGHWGENGTLDLFRSRTDAYRDAARAAGARFFPSCAPGFNDRAIRRTCANNPALSRQLTSSGDGLSHFRAVFKDIALSRLDEEVPLVSITSFNEWHEDTQIEPASGSGSTAKDRSASGSQYTQGFAHESYGTRFLELIRDATIAATGKVLGPGGPIAGATVRVLEAGGEVLVRRSFSTGVYTVPRLRLRPGASYRLEASAPGLLPVTTALTVDPARARTGLDISLAANRPPTARIAVRPSSEVRLEGGSASVTLDGSASDDGDGGTQGLTYFWQKAGGPAGGEPESPTAPSTRVTFAAAGIHVYRLAVDDGQAASSADTAEAAVTVRPGLPRVSRGDCNGDRAQDVSDAIALLAFLFAGGARPPCLEACDSNGDDAADISDAVHLLAHLFLGGPPSASPAFPACEPYAGSLGCAQASCG
ncbi:MAG: hypothetical protein HY721_02385 [Planctomycetes bacterium]|nr:hypothetical protein [Planctomycetota bacterium]